MTAAEAERILRERFACDSSSDCVLCSPTHVALDFLMAELARKDEALREIMADDALFEANPDAFGRHAWARIRAIACFTLSDGPQ